MLRVAADDEELEEAETESSLQPPPRKKPKPADDVFTFRPDRDDPHGGL
jgi:hypothetical protein